MITRQTGGLCFARFASSTWSTYIYDRQQTAYFLTLNNPNDYGYDAEKIKDIIHAKFKHVIYWAMCDEMDTTYHTHVYRINAYAHPYDSYACQNIMVFDEFRSQLPLANMLQYCDIYPIELPARYNNKFACYNEVFIISNWDLKKQYSELHSRDRETWEAFLRRISEVIEFLPDGKRIYHGDALSYINKTDFTPIPK